MTKINKKLYLISYYFAPLGRADGVNRTYLVKHLAEHGWNIEVISCQNPHGFMRSFQKDPSLLDVIPANVTLHPVDSYYWGPIGGIAELIGLTNDSFANWIKPAKQMAEKIVNEPGIVYAVAPPVTNAKIASYIAKKRKLPLVIDFRDDDFKHKQEHVQQAATIIASTETSLAGMRKYYNLQSDNGIVMFNGYAMDKLPTLPAADKQTDKLRIVYAGLLNRSQEPILLAKAVRLMEEKYPHTKGKVIIDYYGPQNYYTRMFLPEYLSENVRFNGYIPLEKVLAEIAKADLAYTSLRDDGKAYCIPSKVFQYIAMETPILAVGPGGALQKFINEHRVGRYSFSDNLESQAEDIYFFLQNRQEKDAVAQHIQQIKPQFSMHAQAKKLSDHLEQLLEK